MSVCVYFSLHPLKPDHGLGREGHRDPLCGDGTLGRGLHAQTGTETEVSVGEERQSESLGLYAA